MAETEENGELKTTENTRKKGKVEGGFLFDFNVTVAVGTKAAVQRLASIAVVLDYRRFIIKYSSAIRPNQNTDPVDKFVAILKQRKVKLLFATKFPALRSVVH